LQSTRISWKKPSPFDLILSKLKGDQGFNLLQVCLREAVVVKEVARLEVEIFAAHQRTRQTYGPERLQRALLDNGVKVGVYRIKRIRRKLSLRCCQKKRFKATTNSRNSLPVAEYLLDQKFEASAPNQFWLTDLTYIPEGEGWLD